MKRWLRVLLVAVVLVLAAGAALVWMQRPVEVDVVELRHAPLVRTLQFAARVETLSRVDVGSTMTGRVEKVLVREGESVREGGLLVELESAELRATLAQAQASRAQAQAREPVRVPARLPVRERCGPARSPPGGRAPSDPSSATARGGPPARPGSRASDR